MKSIRNACCGLAIALGMLAIPSSAAGALDVNVDTSGDGTTGCTLRAAIDTANTNSDQQGCHSTPTIGFTDNVQISAFVSSAINLNDSSIDVSDGDAALFLEGPGANWLAVRGPGSSRVFDISDPGTGPPGGLVSISGMTIEHGHVASGPAAGGGINVASGASLFLERVAVTENGVTLGPGKGAGIYVAPSGSLLIRDSTVSDNLFYFQGACSALGGGVFADLGSSLTIERSTVSHNFGGGSGGGIYAQGHASLESDTVAGNQVCEPTDGANITMSGGGSIRNTLVARFGAVWNNCALDASTFSGGFNLEDGNSCGFDQPTDQASVANPGLAAPADNGGPTETQALLPGSPAIDRGDSFNKHADQRGFPRPVDFPGLANAGDGSDIGAFERQKSCPGELTPGGPCGLYGYCKGTPTNIVGTEGPDQIVGTPGADVIAALGGNDKVSGLAGGDLICGGDGKDTLKGGKGTDALLGEAGKDKLKGGSGNDTLRGGPGKDKLKGGPGKDKQIQ